ncbi:hypothetical protein SUNI508_06144 [Seiridium unicorne]|uniref:DUF6594 domain-containing protein n=1 Tax=Seiridium unicorne TaxID=138068 RepID=A0ABR2V2E1_9PEZI
MDFLNREGYARVAHLMASQDEFAIVRRFKALNMQDLLYRQAEITHLESELTELAHRDSRHFDREYFAKDWYSLSQGSSGEDREQWQKFEELREKLNAYNDALLKQSQLAQLPRPRAYDLDFLRSWFERPGMGAFPLLGADRKSWNVQHGEDLIGIKARIAPDPLSTWFVEKFVPVFHHFVGARFREPISAGKIGSGIYNYSDCHLSVALRVVTTVTASLLPLCSVVALYMIPSSDVRLGLVVVFSACFSLALATMTNARAIEVFAATAAWVKGPGLYEIRLLICA